MEKITVRMIFEVLGRPPEHVKEALETVVMRLGAEKGVKIAEKIYHPPKKVEGAENLFTSFAEVELELESLSLFFGILFTYFPSNVEVLGPSSLKLKNSEINELGNNLITRIHHYDSITKKLLAERSIIINQLKEKGIELKFENPENSKEKPAEKKSKKSKKSKA